MATTTADRTAWLDRLLRGERSAVETYQQASTQCEGETCAMDLMHIAGDHRNAVALLEEHIRQRGGTPSHDSGAWGNWAALVTGTAKLFGQTSTFKALKEGEEHGLKEYESALEDEDVDPECKQLIRSTLVPRQREHIHRLDALMSSND